MVVRSKQEVTNLSDEERELYEQMLEEREEELASLVALLLAEEITREVFIERLREQVREYYIDLAVAARGEGDLTDRDLDDLSHMIALTGAFIDGFEKDLLSSEELPSDRMMLWRTGLYGFAWDVFTRFFYPRDYWVKLPAWPGIDCLGGSACGCHWLVEDAGNEIHFYWVVDPVKDHCAVCLANEMEYNPFIVEL